MTQRVIARKPAGATFGSAVPSAAPALKVGRPDDAFEHEADRMADEVMSDAGPAAQWSLSRMSIAPPLQRKTSGRADMGHAPAIVHDLLRSGGTPLDRSARSFFEPRFGHDFGNVRVHIDSQAASSAKAVGALAYTVGSHLVFASGQYRPHGEAGRRLLAHELAHVSLNPAGTPTTLHRCLDPRHARGYHGEQGMGFGYSTEKGWIFVEGPGGAGGHGVTASGFDGVAYNVKADELHLIDNKSLKASTVRSATAITVNLQKNLDGLITRVQATQDLPSRIRILELLRQMRAALNQGKPLPGNTKLVVTGVGGRANAVSPTLQALGVEFREPGATDPMPSTPSTGGPPAQAAPKASQPAAAKPAPAKPAPAPAPAPAGKGSPQPAAATAPAELHEGETHAGPKAGAPAPQSAKPMPAVEEGPPPSTAANVPSKPTASPAGEVPESAGRGSGLLRSVGHAAATVGIDVLISLLGNWLIGKQNEQSWRREMAKVDARLPALLVVATSMFPEGTRLYAEVTVDVTEIQQFVMDLNGYQSMPADIKAVSVRITDRPEPETSEAIAHYESPAWNPEPRQEDTTRVTFAFLAATIPAKPAEGSVPA